MDKKIPILILIPIVMVTLFLVYAELTSTSIQTSETNFIYSDTEKIQKILANENISMSSPSVITDHTVKQYCTYFDDNGVQQFVTYCITTAILDSDEKPLGNINMGGNPIEPNVALALIETSPSFDSRSKEIGIIFETMVKTLVCDCWTEKQPGGFKSVPAWINATEQKYHDSPHSTLTSKIDGLAQKQLILEITPSGDSYLWTLIIVS